MFYSSIASGALVVMGLAALGCRELGPQVEARDDFAYSKPAGPRKALVLNNINGNIVVTGVDGSTTVEITAVKIVKASSADEAHSHLADIKIDVTESDTALNVETDQPNGNLGRSYSVQYQIKVPSDWMVSLDNTNGNVQLVNVKNDVETSITNGDFAGQGLQGSIDVELTNGRIGGDMKLPENGECSLTTTNGTIDTKLDMPASASAGLETTNGKITLEIPRGISAALSAESSVGSVNITGLEIKELQRERDGVTGESVSGTLGNGGGSLDLSVTNGAIAVKGY